MVIRNVWLKCTDHKKYADRVLSRFMLVKLSKISLSDPIIVWLRSYLLGRTYLVKRNQKVSSLHRKATLTPYYFPCTITI